MIVPLVKRIMDGPERTLRDSRSGLSVGKGSVALVVERDSRTLLLVDLVKRELVKSDVHTVAEARAVNRVLELLEIEAQLIPTKGRFLLEVKKDGILKEVKEWT